MNRIHSIDITRGIVMVIMALDHVRDLLHVDSLTENPTNLETTTPILFFTRFITHLCAPTFVFLSGTSAYLTVSKQNNLRESRRYLITRGLWLVVLEFTLITFGIFSDIHFHLVGFLVIAAIGFGFIILGLSLTLSSKVLGAIGITILVIHNLIPLTPIVGTPFAWLFLPNAIPLTANNLLMIGYPPIPWLGIMLIGFSTGSLFLQAKEKRNVFFLRWGIIGLLLFILLRFLNIYGDPVPWQHQLTGTYSFLSFLNVTKYPPSLSFCLIMLSGTFLLLRFSDNLSSRIMSILQVYGKVPLFYFLVHFYVIHLILFIVLFAQGFSWNDMTFAGGTYGRPAGTSSGLGLGLTYVVWISVVVGLYLPCRWFGKLKSKKRFWWTQYL